MDGLEEYPIPSKQVVAGSIPAGPTIAKQTLCFNGAFLPAQGRLRESDAPFGSLRLFLLQNRLQPILRDWLPRLGAFWHLQVRLTQLQTSRACPSGRDCMIAAHRAGCYLIAGTSHPRLRSSPSTPSSAPPDGRFRAPCWRTSDKCLKSELPVANR